jgi:hypothetical protein
MTDRADRKSLADELDRLADCEEAFVGGSEGAAKTMREAAKHLRSPAPEGGAVKGPGDYTMVLTEPQAFEKFPALASHIERMAVGRSVGSLIEWDAFLRELNAALATREDAPAEAGERDYPAEFEAWWATYRHRNRDVADYSVKKQIAFDAFYHAALRARSSAPEALGNLLAVIHGDGGHRALEVGTKQAALEAEKIVAGLFAAPSADKLRGLVGASEDILSALSALSVAGKPIASLDTKLRDAINTLVPALAALQAEQGAKR